MTSSTLRLWHESQDLSVGAVGQDIQRPIRAFADAANPGIQLGQQTLLADDAIVFQDEADEGSSHQCRYEQIASPRRKARPVVEGDARGRDVRRPEVRRLFHSGLRGFVTVDRLA